MTQGPILRQVILFSLPMMLGNAFQMLYNTVDSIVVGQFVGTQALAAVGSTTMIVNLFVFFFNGFSIGAGVVIATHFGAHDLDKLHAAVETTMAATIILSIVLSVGGVLAVKPMLRLMVTPADVFDEAALYLRIYIGGISGLLIYNMGSGILRAVGDSTRPLLFLILTSLLNIALDLFFVLQLKMGIAGVAYATIISQFISAGLILRLLSRTKDVYRLSWRDIRIDLSILRRIITVGMPAGIQSVLTAFSNVFVQSYINAFGSSCMAGWGSYNKLDQFIMLPVQSMGMAATTFVSQNVGAGQEKRADKGTLATLGLSCSVNAFIIAVLYVFAEPAVRLFTQDESVIFYGVLFIRSNSAFLLFSGINHVFAGSLRGRGDSRGPMLIMLASFVGVRQAYLFLMTRYGINTPFWVGFGYPVGWIICGVWETLYYYSQRKRAKRLSLADRT